MNWKKRSRLNLTTYAKCPSFQKHANAKRLVLGWPRAQQLVKRRAAVVAGNATAVCSIVGWEYFRLVNLGEQTNPGSKITSQSSTNNKTTNTQVQSEGSAGVHHHGCFFRIDTRNRV